mmetsp:Transcript_8207/g.27265  ORF Transcript_8207/g.27265 Transcript_8207/m.27265 type:complete len:122 (-) Transcript_8207:1039-1404(-)
MAATVADLDNGQPTTSPEEAPVRRLSRRLSDHSRRNSNASGVGSRRRASSFFTAAYAKSINVEDERERAGELSDFKCVTIANVTAHWFERVRYSRCAFPVRGARRGCDVGGCDVHPKSQLS